ncbi:cache domain-containing protein [bacterium]|nr:cache domain-containing protein [bacterium]
MKIVSTGLKLQLIVLATIITAAIIITFQSVESIRHLSRDNIQKYTQEAYLNEERELKNYISIALQTIDLYYKNIPDKNNAKTSKEYERRTKEVQQKVLNILSDMRFGESGYFWINDKTPKMIMHPIHPELDGKDLSDYKDSNNMKLFSEMVKVVNEKGEGTLTYYWPRKGYPTAQAKRSYVKLFEPWGWIIGTGEYIDHIEKRIAKMKVKEQQEIDELIVRSIAVSTIISIILILSVYFIIKKAIITPMNKREIEANIIKQNAQELRALTDNIPGFAYKYRRFADKKEEFLYASSGVIEVYGVTSQVALNNIAAVRAKMYPEDMPGYRAAVDESARTLSPFHYEFRVMHPTKGELWLESRSSPQLNKNDDSIVWYGITLDITERKKQEALLIKKEQQYRTLAENIPDPIFRYDTDAKRIYVNPAVEKISGISAAELLGKQPTQKTLVSSKESEIVKNSILKVIRTGKPDTVEVVFNTPDGRKIYYQDNHIPEFGPDGKVESVLTIVRDITAQKMLATREEMFRTLAENSPDIIMRYDEEANRIYANPAFSEQTGIPKEVMIGNKPETQWGIYFKMLNMSASEYQNKIKHIIKTGES